MYHQSKFLPGIRPELLRRHLCIQTNGTHSPASHASGMQIGLLKRLSNHMIRSILPYQKICRKREILFHRLQAV